MKQLKILELEARTYNWNFFQTEHLFELQQLEKLFVGIGLKEIVGFRDYFLEDRGNSNKKLPCLNLLIVKRDTYYDKGKLNFNLRTLVDGLQKTKRFPLLSTLLYGEEDQPSIRIQLKKAEKTWLHNLYLSSSSTLIYLQRGEGQELQQNS